MTSRNYGSPSAAVPKKLVVLISGVGSNLQALLDACRDPEYGAVIAAVGADREDALGLEIAAGEGVPAFVCKVRDYPDRERWDAGLTETVASFEPDLVISAGFLKLCGTRFLSAFPGRYINTHNSLLPAFPGMNGPGEALAAGVKLAGATLFICDAGVDTGPIIAQTAVPVEDDDTVDTLTERIKEAERDQLVDSVGRMVREGWTVEGRRVRLG